MNSIYYDDFLLIVEEGLLNKYPGMDRAHLKEIFDACWERIAAAPDARSIIAELRIIQSPEDDVNNQAAILGLIERFWSKSPCIEQLLVTLNSAALGTIGNPKYRTREFVADYGGKVLTSREEVFARLDELERLCRHTIDYMAACSLSDKALQLAYIHGAIIRIHPFEDGNGRTARLFTQYALLSWGLPPTPLPKVRNDHRWGSAISEAVSGNATALQAELLDRIRARVERP